jgi:hypothetical protein
MILVILPIIIICDSVSRIPDDRNIAAKYSDLAARIARWAYTSVELHRSTITTNNSVKLDFGEPVIIIVYFVVSNHNHAVIAAVGTAQSNGITAAALASTAGRRHT